MAKRLKGWKSRRPKENAATHYVRVEPTADVTGASLCGRARIRITEPDLSELPRPDAKALRALEVCDHCQTADRKERAAAKKR